MKRLLYLGLRAPLMEGVELIHYPVIRIEPLPLPTEVMEAWPRVTHLVVTSPTAAELLPGPSENRTVVALGDATARCLPHVDYTASEETSEGVIELLQRLEFSKQSLVFVTRSSRSRDLIRPALERRGVMVLSPVLYATHLYRPAPPPDISQFDAIVFTSPSTVDGFLALYGTVPADKELIVQGPITHKRLRQSTVHSILTII